MMNELNKKLTGTSFKGYLYARYDQLVVTFGAPRQPHDSDNKIDAEWSVDTPYGIATIYNYKDGKAYLGESGLSPKNICAWHVGGKYVASYIYVKHRFTSHSITNR